MQHDRAKNSYSVNPIEGLSAAIVIACHSDWHTHW